MSSKSKALNRVISFLLVMAMLLPMLPGVSLNFDLTKITLR